jgi:hypothetical protein
MICIECKEREAIRVPRSLLPICQPCVVELSTRPPAAAPVFEEPPEFKQLVRGQLGLFGQVGARP